MLSGARWNHHQDESALEEGAAGVLLDTRTHSTQAGFMNKASLPQLGQTCLQTLQPIPKILPACTAPEMEL